LPTSQITDKNGLNYIAKGKVITIINKSGGNCTIYECEGGNFAISNNTAVQVVMGENYEWFRVN